MGPGNIPIIGPGGGNPRRKLIDLSNLPASMRATYYVVEIGSRTPAILGNDGLNISFTPGGGGGIPPLG